MGNKRNGTGVYENANGDIYLGEWQNDQPFGEGIEILATKERYEGEVKNWKREGEGTFYFSNGDIYKGGWAGNLKHGNGLEEYANGDNYEG